MSTDDDIWALDPDDDFVEECEEDEEVFLNERCCSCQKNFCLVLRLHENLCPICLRMWKISFCHP